MERAGQPFFQEAFFFLLGGVCLMLHWASGDMGTSTPFWRFPSRSTLPSKHGHTKSIEARQQAHGLEQPGSSRCYRESKALIKLYKLLYLSIYRLYNRNKIDKMAIYPNNKIKIGIDRWKRWNILLFRWAKKAQGHQFVGEVVGRLDKAERRSAQQ